MLHLSDFQIKQALTNLQLRSQKLSHTVLYEDKVILPHLTLLLLGVGTPGGFNPCCTIQEGSHKWTIFGIAQFRSCSIKQWFCSWDSSNVSQKVAKLCEIGSKMNQITKGWKRKEFKINSVISIFFRSPEEEGEPEPEPESEPEPGTED